MGFLPYLLAVPLIEIAGFVWIGPYLGVGGTLAWIILTGMLGMAIIRRQGFETLVRLRAAASAGETPLPVAVDGGVQVFAGLLLAVPGFFTDAIGLLLLIPPLRALAVAWALGRLAKAGARVHVAQPGQADRTVIETEYEIVEREVPPDRRID